jgi:membrane protein implicated in regulation of membrane protease activity
MRSDPRFPAAALSFWLAVFCAAVALLTVWWLPLGLSEKLVLTLIFVLVPLVILVFWLGRRAEARDRDDDRPPRLDNETGR